MLEVVRPTVYTGGLFEDIDPERLLYEIGRLKRRPVKAVTVDIDSTMVAQRQPELSPKNLAVVKAFTEFVPIGIISNAGSEVRDERAREIGRDIAHNMVVVTSHEIGGWRSRKPFRPSFDEASHRLKVPNDGIVHIGDQLLKDVLGAKRSGYMAGVLVEPCAPKDDPRLVRYPQRAPEAVLLETMGIPYGVPYIEEPRLVSDGYRAAKKIGYAGAAAFGLAGVGEVIYGQALTAAVSELYAAGFVNAAIFMRTKENQERVIEGLN
jgi:HAD superfamily phosphatase (TIGR01668 family)